MFQGFECSIGPKNISYNLSVSAPYLSQIKSGFTTLYLDFDIFSTSLSTKKLEFSVMNSESLKFVSSDFNLSKFNSSFECTKLIST